MIPRVEASIENVVAGLVGGLTLLCVIYLWKSLVEDRPRHARLRAIARRRRESQLSKEKARQRRRAQPASGLFPALAQRLRLLQASQAEKIVGKLEKAGMRSREAVASYLIAKLVCPVAGACTGLLLFYAMSGRLPLPVLLLMACGTVALGFFGPEIFVSNQATKRRQAMQKSLPDALDLLVICAEAGLTLDVALHRVAEELGRSAPELADELTVTSVELNFLPDRKLALQNLAKRTELPAIRSVVSTLVQTERYGTPLAQTLRVLSADFREQRMLRAEEKAARLPATLTVPMIVFILPTLFIVLIGPAIIDILDRMSS